jgi:hypothetical protein
MLGVIFAECHTKALYAECHIQARYVKCHYTECRCAECRGATTETREKLNTDLEF